MSEYRIFCLEGDGQISLVEAIVADDDADAVRQAHDIKRNARKCEIWRDKRLVAVLNANDLAD